MLFCIQLARSVGTLARGAETFINASAVALLAFLFLLNLTQVCHANVFITQERSSGSLRSGDNGKLSGGAAGAPSFHKYPAGRLA